MLLFKTKRKRAERTAIAAEKTGAKQAAAFSPKTIAIG